MTFDLEHAADRALRHSVQRLVRRRTAHSLKSSPARLRKPPRGLWRSMPSEYNREIPEKHVMGYLEFFFLKASMTHAMPTTK